MDLLLPPALEERNVSFAAKNRLRQPHPVPIFRVLLEPNRLSMRRPKGIKTKKSVAKRFKITARGKVLRPRAGKRHLLASKGPKRRRSLGTLVVVEDADTYRIKANMPFDR